MSNKNNKNNKINNDELSNNFVFKTESTIINNDSTSYSTINNNLSKNQYDNTSNTTETNTTETNTTETNTTETNTTETNTTETNTIENETIENETIENETIENETIENETIENETIENNFSENEIDTYKYKNKKNDKSCLIEFSDYNTELEDKLYNKYIKNGIKTKKIKEEIKDIEKKTTNAFDLGIIKNNLDETKKNLDQGYTIYRTLPNNSLKICSNQNCSNLSNLSKCSKECYKNNLYKSIKNFNRGIKTIYNLLFKLLLSYPNFRIQCKCCEKEEYMVYLNELDKNFIQEKKNINENINNNLEPIKIMELNINFLINKFMNTIGVLDCECNFKNKYYSFYSHDYLNFSSTIKIYIRTIPKLISFLKSYWEIKDNHEELILIDDSRCIHEDIRYNNLTYCIKKKYNTYNKKYYNELVMNLDLVNVWTIESIKITNILFNQQSLEHFIYNFENKPEQIDILFEKIYNIKNQFLDLNYVSNKKNIITVINDYYKNTNNKKIDKLFEILYKQLVLRNKIITNYNVPNIIINFMIKSIGRNNKLLSFKLLKYIKNIKNTNNQKNILNLKYLEIIFNELLDNSDMNTETKISYLKIINKNNINIIEYDFVNKLIEIDIGDKIILEFNKEENTLFNIDDYSNQNYIENILKKCIINNRKNILDYVLFNLDKSIKEYSIDTISIYLLNIPKITNINKYDLEYKYIDLLNVIIKYYTKNNFKISTELDNTKFTPIEYCIENKLNKSAKILIKNSIGLTSLKKNFNLFIKCFEKNNFICFENLILKDKSIINYFYNNINILTFIFLYHDKKYITTDSLLIFLFKIFKIIIEDDIEPILINYQDEYNQLVGFKILNSNLSSQNKILLFKLISDIVNPLEINNFIFDKNTYNTYNYPLIIHSMLLNELEITFIFLNYLIKNSYIKKNNKSNESIKIFDYYLVNEQININFIPIVFKYIKDNSVQCNIFQNNLVNNYSNLEFLPSVKNTFDFILLIMSFVIILIYSKNINLNKNNKNIFNNNINININKNESKYLEITLDSNLDISVYNNLTHDDNNINNNNNEKIKPNSKTEIKHSSVFNKNIWIQNSNLNSNLIKKNINMNDLIKDNNDLLNYINTNDDNTYNTYNTYNINNSDKINNLIKNQEKFNILNDSSVSESDILFEN